MFRPLAIAAMLVAPALFACGTQPIARVALPGTTIAIPVPPTYYPGFGLRIGTDPQNAPAYDPNSLFEDPQRGELMFLLVDPSTLPEPTPIGYLPRRWITRAALDESSPEALDGSFEGIEGQVIAFVDIPVTVPPDDYEIYVERWRRDPSASYEFDKVPTKVKNTVVFGGNGPYDWNGWGDPNEDPQVGIPITIQGPAVNPPRFTELFGWADVFDEFAGGAFSDQQLRDHTPYPSFAIHAGAGPTWPAAAEMEFDYPIERMRIRGVKLYRSTPSNAIVRWEAEDPNATIGCTPPAPGRLKIKMIDPDREALGVEVAYELRNFDQSCGDRVVPDTDISFVSSTYKAYDEDGVLLTSSSFLPVVYNLDR